MGNVYKVLIHCPVSYSEVDTGIRTSGREFLSSDIYESGGVLCPNCNHFHRFSDEGFLSVAEETLAQEVWSPNP